MARMLSIKYCQQHMMQIYMTHLVFGIVTRLVSRREKMGQ